MDHPQAPIRREIIIRLFRLSGGATDPQGQAVPLAQSCFGQFLTPEIHQNPLSKT